MRILIYSVNFAPEPTGIGKYSGEMAAWLVNRGHEVRVVAAPPYYPSWKVNPTYLWPPFRREQWRGVEVWRVPLWVPKSPGGWKRVLHLLSFAVLSFPIMLWQIVWRPDLVLTVAPAFVCAPAGLITARLSRARAWLHMQDFEIDVAFGLGLLRGKRLQTMVLTIERWVLCRFDTVSTISARMIEHLLTKGVSPAKTRYFPNWVDITRIRPLSEPGFREQLGIPGDSVVALFSGTLGSKQGLMVIPEAAKLLALRKDIVFVVCGDGVMKGHLVAATADLPNFILMPLQPKGRVGDLLAMADIHLLPQSPDAADLVLPSKLSGMLASGRPVIATCNDATEISAIVAECGLVVPPENGARLAAAIARLADDPALRLELGGRARDFAERHFEREAVLGALFGPFETEIGVVANDVAA